MNTNPFPRVSSKNQTPKCRSAVQWGTLEKTWSEYVATYLAPWQESIMTAPRQQILRPPMISYLITQL